MCTSLRFRPSMFVLCYVVLHIAGWYKRLTPHTTLRNAYVNVEALDLCIITPDKLCVCSSNIFSMKPWINISLWIQSKHPFHTLIPSSLKLYTLSPQFGELFVIFLSSYVYIVWHSLTLLIKHGSQQVVPMECIIMHFVKHAVLFFLHYIHWVRDNL